MSSVCCIQPKQTLVRQRIFVTRPRTPYTKRPTQNTNPKVTKQIPIYFKNVILSLKRSQSPESQSYNQRGQTRPGNRRSAFFLLRAGLGGVLCAVEPYSLHACHLGLCLGDKTAISWVKEGENRSDTEEVLDGRPAVEVTLRGHQ